MDAKDVWVVAKFLVAATGLKRRDARRMLDEIPPDRYSRLFLMARGWERDSSQQASRQLEDLLGNDTLGILREATQLAKTPSGPGVPDDDDDEPDTPPMRGRGSKRTTRRASR
jgi:hypothetical protein